MKTVADFKRRIAKDVILHTIYHQEFNGRDGNGLYQFKDVDKGNRKVNIVMSTQFTLLTFNTTKNTFIDSYMKFPKVSECKFIDENTTQILSPDFRGGSPTEGQLIPLLTYKFITE